MTFDPSHPAPILDEHIRRIRAYLTVTKGHQAFAAQIAAALSIPRNTLDSTFFRARARAAGVERIRIESRGGRRPTYAGYRLADQSDDRPA